VSVPVLVNGERQQIALVTGTDNQTVDPITTSKHAHSYKQPSSARSCIETKLKIKLNFILLSS
jgi:hypothetical protein